MSDFLDWLLGQPDTPTAPRRPFPTSDDVDFARQVGGFHHEGGGVPTPSRVLAYEDAPQSLSQLRDTPGRVEQRPDILNLVLRNRLASRRSALSSLGFPSDALFGDKMTYGSVAGATMYEDENDDPFTFVALPDLGRPSTLTHEGIHRGLLRVLQSIDNETATPDQLRLIEAIRDPRGMNEDMVRVQMRDKFSDAEVDNLPKSVEMLFDNPNFRYRQDEARKLGDLAETLAQRLVYENKKSGPW